MSPAERRDFWRVVGWGALALLVGLGVVVAGVNHADRDREVLGRLEAAQARAGVAEAQVAEMLRAIEGGVLLANINTVDMGRAELRLRPAGR